MKKTSLILLFVLSFGLHSFAQDRRVDVLELLYEQKNYRTIVRKTKRLIRKKGYSDNELVHLFQAAALAQLAQDKRYFRSHPEAIENSVVAYSNYYELDKEHGFVQKESVLLGDLKTIYKSVKKVSIPSEAFAYVMNTNPELAVTSKKKVIVVKTKVAERVSYPDNFDAKEVDTVCEIAALSAEDKMIGYAKKFIGVPYVYGGTGDGGFDCSGYTQYILNKHGHEVPRSARTQMSKTEPIKVKRAKKGDLIFFSNRKKKSHITHVGLVISEEGENLTMIHASSSRGIMITDVSTNTYWKPRLVAAGRPKKKSHGAQ
ncbi:MAG: C40 family peptidase [Flavobacteriales bacterium]